jgi:hypothetical protein
MTNRNRNYVIPLKYQQMTSIIQLVNQL